MTLSPAAETPPEFDMEAMLRNFQLARDEYVWHHKSQHWDIFGDKFRAALADANSWRDFRRNGMSMGLDTSKVSPSAQHIPARAAQRLRDATDELLRRVGEDFARRMLENTIGNPVVFEHRSLGVTHTDLRLVANVWRLDQILPRTTDGLFVVEIGGGYGGFAAKLKRLRANAVVILFDLPEITALQTYYLSRAHPGARLYTLELHRAGKLNELLAGSYDFAVLPGWCIADFPAGFCDCAVNLRSMMEMNLETVRFYMSAIERSMRPGGLFYCVNRYRKTTTGEVNRIKDYPFDSHWMATISEPAWDQPWIHEIVAVRQTMPNVFPISAGLRDLPPWTAAELARGLGQWLSRTWLSILGNHPSIVPGIPGVLRNGRVNLQRQMASVIRRYPRLRQALQRLRP